MQSSDPSNFFQTDASIEKDEKRRVKSLRAAQLGDPITTPSKVIKLEVRSVLEEGSQGGTDRQDAWTAESGWVARRVDLETGQAITTFRGHQGPVTCIAFYDLPIAKDSATASSGLCVLFTGSWDRSIKIWDTRVLVSAGSDKLLHVWDLRSFDPSSPAPLRKVAELKDHTRPVECFAFSEDHGPAGPATLFSGDSMGVIKIWRLSRSGQDGSEVQVRATDSLTGHQTSVSMMQLAEGGLWTGSTDEDVRVYDVSSMLERAPNATAKQLKPLIAHCNEVTAIREWVRVVDGKRVPYIVTTGLDCTIRKWTLHDILNPPPLPELKAEEPASLLTEDEERELAELMDED